MINLNSEQLTELLEKSASPAQSRSAFIRKTNTLYDENPGDEHLENIYTSIHNDEILDKVLHKGLTSALAECDDIQWNDDFHIATNYEKICDQLADVMIALETSKTNVSALFSDYQDESDASSATDMRYSNDMSAYEDEILSDIQWVYDTINRHQSRVSEIAAQGFTIDTKVISQKLLAYDSELNQSIRKAISSVINEKIVDNDDMILQAMIDYIADEYNHVLTPQEVLKQRYETMLKLKGDVRLAITEEFNLA